MKKCKKCEKELDLLCYDTGRNVCKKCKYTQTKESRQKIVILNENRLDFVETKDCNKCNKTLKREEFNRRNTTEDGLCNTCRKCYNSSRKSKNIIVSDLSKNKICNTCNNLKALTDFGTCAKSKDNHFHRCKQCCKPRQWTKLAARIKSALKEVSLRKKHRTYEYIGCSYDFLKEWIGFQFQEEMSWENIGLWHIDHVTPCASFDLTNPEDLLTCFNWQNLRPCWAEENMMKGSKIISEVIENQEQMVKQFIDKTTTKPSW